jgi:hypothetical protein
MIPHKIPFVSKKASCKLEPSTPLKKFHIQSGLCKPLALVRIVSSRKSLSSQIYSTNKVPHTIWPMQESQRFTE